MAKQIGSAGSGARKMGRRRLFVGYGLLIVFLLAGYRMLTGGQALRAFLGPRWGYLGTTVAAGGLGFIGVALWALMNDEVDVPVLRAIRGAIAEEGVSAVLGNLPEGFVILNDVACPVGNIDHIVAGPTGLFVVETKSHRGTITGSTEGKLMRSGKPLEKHFINQALSQAFWLREELSKHGIQVFVNGVVVFTRAFVKVYKPIKGIRVLNKKWLVEHIQNNDGRLDQEIQNKIVGHLTPMVEAAKGRSSEQGANRS
jgi:hypothetical protein